MIGSNDLPHPSPAPHIETFQVFLIFCPKRPSFSTIQSHAPNVAFYWFLPQIYLQFVGKRSLLLVEGSFAFAILDLISHVHLPSFNKKLAESKYVSSLKSPLTVNIPFISVLKICVLFFSTTFEIFFILRRLQRHSIKLYRRMILKYLLFLSDFKEIYIFLSDCREILKYQFLWTPVLWEPSYSMRRDRNEKTKWHLSQFCRST